MLNLLKPDILRRYCGNSASQPFSFNCSGNQLNDRVALFPETSANQQNRAYCNQFIKCVISKVHVLTKFLYWALILFLSFSLIRSGLVTECYFHRPISLHKI